MSVSEPRAVTFSVLKRGFGKTTTSLNTARELARGNKRVLVVDLDDKTYDVNLGSDTEYRGEGWIDGDEAINHVGEELEEIDTAAD